MLTNLIASNLFAAIGTSGAHPLELATRKDAAQIRFGERDNEFDMLVRDHVPQFKRSLGAPKCFAVDLPNGNVCAGPIHPLRSRTCFSISAKIPPHFF